MLRRVAVFGLFLLVGGCSSNPTPSTTTPPTNGTDIPASVSGPLSATLSTQAQNLNGQSALAAQGALLALQAGVQVTPVGLTGSELALPSAGAGGDALNRSGALATSGSSSGYAFGFQLTILNPPPAPSPQVYSGVLAYEDGSDAVLVMGPAPGSAFPPADGLGFGDAGFWEATAGQESAQLSGTGTSCSGSLPSYVTCTKASFTNAGFNITASTPVAGATGSKTAALQSNGSAISGVALTLDFTQVSVSVSPASETLQTGETFQFYALVTGPPNTPTNVSWSVEETNGGTVSQAGLYSAPNSPGTYHVVATTDSGAYGSATVTVVNNPSPPDFVHYWAGPYSLTAASGSTLLSGGLNFAINESATGLYMALLCVLPAEVDATVSGSTFSLVPFTAGTSCPLAATAPCPEPTISYSGGTGMILANGELTISFAGTVTGLDANNCGAATQFTGSFGPADAGT